MLITNQVATAPCIDRVQVGRSTFEASHENLKHASETFLLR
jgi:hypothetical protein